MKSFSSKSADSYLKLLKQTTSKKARSFFLKHGYSSSSFEMPEYYGAENLDQINLKKINWKRVEKGKEKIPITNPLNILTPKGFLSWRNFNLLHPFAFVHIVNEITENSSWLELRKILSKKTKVNCYSTPKFSTDENESEKVNGITRWIQMAENDLVKDSVGYSFLTVTDIKNFYPSIYTHSIAWAVNGKAVAKSTSRRWDMVNMLGNRLDRLFQSARDGQTNGIPVGSMVSDFVAEVILKDVDVKLSTWLKDQTFRNDILISRFRDDYRFLSKTSEHGKLILKELSKILDREYNLSLNSEKTKIYDDILEGSFRDWSNEINDDYLLREVKYNKLPKKVTISLLKDVLLKTYRLQKKYPEGRASITLLSKLSAHLNGDDVLFDGFDKTEIHTIISVLRKLALIREDVSTQTYLLLDVLLKQLTDKQKLMVINDLIKVVRGGKDHDYQLIWLFRLCLSNCPEKCQSILDSADSPLMNLLKIDYIDPFPFSYNFEVFESVSGLTQSDSEELRKFTFVNYLTFTAANAISIDSDFYELFRY